MAIEKPSRPKWWGSFRIHFKHVKEKVEELIDHSNFYLSAEQSGNGTEQSIAHGLSGTPAKVAVFVTGWDAAYEGSTLPTSGGVIEGTHTSTYIKVTATSGMFYRVAAWLK